MPNQNSASRFEETSTSALAVAILIFCEEVKKTNTNVHMTSNSKEPEIRGENKNTIFSHEDKCLVKKLFIFCKEGLYLKREELTRLIVDKINERIPCLDNQRKMLRLLLKNIESKYPRPWRLGAHHDRLIDSEGKVFSYLSAPEFGLSFPDLENLIAINQKSVKINEDNFAGQLVF